VSTKAYDYFITNLGVFEAADRIRETINPIFYTNFRKQQEKLEEGLRQNVDATWEDMNFDVFPKDVPSNKERILPEHIDDYAKCITYDLVGVLYKRMEELKNHPMRTFSLLDIFYDALIMRGPEEDTVVFKVFSECQDYTEALSTQDWCSDFSYWNNTDQDEDVSEEEWERRERFWDAVGLTPPSERSVGFTQPCEFVVFTNIDL
jgi:hypothetical protein